MANLTLTKNTGSAVGGLTLTPKTASTPTTLPSVTGKPGAGAWLPDSVRARMEVKTPAVSVAKPTGVLPTVPGAKPLPDYQRMNAAFLGTQEDEDGRVGADYLKEQMDNTVARTTTDSPLLERGQALERQRNPNAEKTDPGKWLLKNIEAGWQGMGSGLAATYDFLLPTELLFGEEKDPLSNVNRDLRTASQSTAQTADEMGEKMGGLFPVAGKLTQGTVGALPNAALAVMSGGASVPAQLGAQAGGLGTTLTTAITALGKNPGFWMSNAQTLGNSYEGAKAGGANELEATATALITGFLNSAVEVGGGIETLPASLAKNTSEGGVRIWVRSMLEEGREEVIQGVIENMTQMAVYDREKPFVSLQDENAILNPGRMAGEFAMGAGVGGILGGGQMLAGSIGARRAAANTETQTDAFLPGSGLEGQQKTASEVETEYKAEKPRNVELPTVPIINLSMDDVAVLNGGEVPKSGGYIRKAVIDRAAERLGLNQNGAAYIEASNVMRDGDTYVLKITKDSLNKMLSATSYPDRIVPPESVAIVENLERIANNGVYFRSEGDRQGRDQIAGFDHLMTTVYIDSAPYVVDMRVRVYTDKAGGDNRLYHFTPEAITLTKQDDGGSPLGTLHERTISRAGKPPSSDTTIALGVSEVKGQDAPIGGEHTLGAAEGGFDPYTRLQNQYGTIEPGENPARTVDVPKQTVENDRVSATARTVLEAGATPDAFVPEVAQAVVDGKLSYIPITNKDTAGKAQSVIERDGFQRAYGEWRASVAKGKTSADLTAMGATLYNAAVNAGDTKLALDVLGDYAKNIRDAAQATQAARILKTLTPDGRLYLAQKTVLALQEDLNHRFGDGKYNLTINEELADAFLHADGDAAREAAMENIYRDVASQIPSTWVDKWNAWRYFSMLGNPRTHIRNIAGNAGFVPVRVAKDMLATGIEAAADKVLPGGIERTKAALNPLNESDRALLESAWADGGAHMEEILGEGKFRDKPQGKIEEYRTIFKTLPLEAGRQFNTKALDVEDTWFSRPAYATALAGWLKANHTTLDTAAVETLDRARAYAIREAQRATYRDSNAFSDFVSGLRYRGDKKVGQAANVLMEGVLPFRKTPANILVRGVEYSPAGLVKGLTVDLAQVKNGKMSAAQAIDNIAAGLTGTGIMALGALLASMGLVTGGSGDDEKDEHGRTMGKQPYALTIGNKSYTLDWLAPEALPFFVGVEAWGAMEEGEKGQLQFKDVTDAMNRITDPLFEMSMLQGVQDAIDTVKFADGGTLPKIAANAAISYLSQGIPTLFGQAERTMERERQSTYIDRTSQLPHDLQYTLGRVMNKLPGEFQQMPYIDAWGRKQSTGTLPTRAANNFLNPSYVSEEKITGADQEIQRLLEAGQAGVAPNRLSQSTKVGDSYLTKEQYQSYATKKGETSLNVVSELIERKGYGGFSDEEKAEAVRNAYSYADAVGKLATGADYEPSGWVAKAIEAEKQGVSPADYILYRQTLPDGSVSQYEAGSALVGEDMGNREKGALWALQNDSWPSDKNPFIGSLSKAGVKPETAVQIAGKYGEIDKKYDGYVKPEGGASKATAQTTEFYRWLDGLGLTDEQYDAATGLYRFSTYIPGKPEGYRLDLMSEAAQKKWPGAEKAGFSEEEYIRYYPVFSSGTKHDAIEEAVGMGMTRAQANRFWGIVR